MNEPKTPNLGLNKIDRSSPSTTYFDLDKYLDQNWEKVDEGVGQVEEKAEEIAAQVSSIKERLDTEKRRTVTLEPGLQIINAERASAFKLEGIKGRTLVNLLGRCGGMESLTGLNAIRSNLSLDLMNKVDGSSGLKVTVNSAASPSAAGVATVSLPNFKANSFYVLIANVKNGNSVEGANIGFGGEFGGPYSTFVQTTDKFVTVWAKKKVSTQGSGIIDFAVFGNPNQYGYFDSGRLYEISESEYNALDSMNPEQVALKYPYVDSVQPVLNPYVIRYGENLLPPFYEWEISTSQGSYTMSSPYTISITNTSTTWGQYARYYVPVLIGQTYALSVTISDSGVTESCYMYACDASKQRVGNKITNRSITVPAGASYVEIVVNTVDANGAVVGLFTFANPIFNIGNEAKSFKPRKDVMHTLQTDLYADPVTGENGDEVFEQGGQYYKMKKWYKVDFEGSRITSTILGNKSGFKTLYPKLEGANYGYSSMATSAAVKYDGKILTWGSHEAIADGWAIDKLNNNFAISVPNADSGWGDAYTPTVNEIKAYFMGWTMRNMSASNYNDPTNASQKTWTPIGYSPPANWNSTWAHLRTSVPVNESSPSINDGTISTYQLVYQLAIPTVEPITSEGQLTLIEGDNQVEVGTGIVLREGTKPALSTQWGTYEINSNASSVVASNPLKYKAKKVMTIYKNGRSEKWERSTDANSYGLERAYRAVSLFDPSADYKVTYLMLDTFPIAAFVGSVPDNEKALLTNLVHDVQQGATSLSVVERSLSEALKALQNKRNVWGSIE
ncbi:hypothetical protein B2I21_33565 [Chryseobacterium mucoviscidosis]|nr:hypothetical protein B2I21_33565 [Chryseobacterium mucoviscidosis]